MKHVLLRYSCTDSKSEDPQSKTWISGSLTRLFLVSQVVSRLKHLIDPQTPQTQSIFPCEVATNVPKFPKPGEKEVEWSGLVTSAQSTVE